MDRAAGAPNWLDLVRLLECPACRRPMVVLAMDGSDGVLGHDGGACGERFPVIGAIARLVQGDARWLVATRHREWFADERRRTYFANWLAAGASDHPDLAVVERFDREWEEFDWMAAGERSRVFDLYFDLVPATVLSAGPLVLDAGCGSGRWSVELGRRGATVVAMDLGSSVEVAARSGAEVGGVQGVQADVRAAPFRAGTFDLVTVLGVLHHIAETEDALRALVRTLRPGGRLLLYLYYALDQRPAWYRALYRLSDAVRGWVSVLPYPLTRIAATGAAVVLYWPLSRLAAALDAIGLKRATDAVPLSAYRFLSFRTMRNDSLDRFGTRLEKRYTQVEVVRMMSDAGLTQIVVSPNVPYWHAVGVRP